MTEEQAREAAYQSSLAKQRDDADRGFIRRPSYQEGFDAGVEYANRWTYLPELPKDYDFYLVTHKDENDNVMVSESLFAAERWDFDNVIAWRELPEPAKR